MPRNLNLSDEDAALVARAIGTYLAQTGKHLNELYRAAETQALAAEIRDAKLAERSRLREILALLD